MTVEKRGSGGCKSLSGSRGAAPVAVGGWRPPEDETLSFNKHAILNATLITIVKFVAGSTHFYILSKIYCKHGIFTEIRTTRLETPTTYSAL